MLRTIAYILAAALLMAIGLMLFVALQHPVTVDSNSGQYLQEWLAKQRDGLRSGKQSQIYFYESTGTDLLLREFDGETAIKYLTLDLTDLTDEGMRTIAGLPNLERLILIGGRPGVSNRGLEVLRGQSTLTSIYLVNQAVTDDGLTVLQTLPNLKQLTLYRDQFREPLLTDKAISELVKLDKLETLNIPGGWISRAGLSSLRTALPDCRVVEEENWDLVVAN